MNFAETLFSTLGPLVTQSNGRIAVYPAVFPQEYGLPAIRYNVTSGVPFTDLCDGGDEATDEIHVQLDIVALTYAAALAKKDDVRAAMSALTDPPVVLDDWSGPEYDAEAKQFAVRMDYSLQGSSD